MPPLDEYAVKPQHIEVGVVALKKRQRNLVLLCIASSTLLLASLVALFLQHDLVYSFFGVTTELKQLHMPSSVDAELIQLGQHSDYFTNLLSWFGWFILKLFVSFTGTFFVIRFLKKIPFFLVRFQSFILKFVGWFIAFILLWSSLSYLQHELNDTENNAYADFIHYDKNIQQSELAQYLADDSTITAPVKAYLLAQTALLHQPVDKDAAIPQILTLVKAEQQDPKFIEYGFKPEQIWTMQQQVYGKTLTPFATSVSKQVTQADSLSKWVRFFMIGFILLFALFSLIFGLLAYHLKGRSLRVEQRLKD